MFRRDMTYAQASFACGFGSDRTNRRDAQRGKRFHDIELQRLRAIDQGADGIGAGEQEPIKAAQFAKRLIQRSKIVRRMESDHRRENSFGAARLEFTNQGLGLFRRARDENVPASESRGGGLSHAGGSLLPG